MAKRICREENGDIRFDYDMAIALPFEKSRPNADGRYVAAVQGAWEKPLLVLRGEVVTC